MLLRPGQGSIETGCRGSGSRRLRNGNCGDRFPDYGGSNRHGGPCGGGGGDPLIVVVGKTTLEIRLELYRAATHVPGTIWILGGQQVLETTLVDRIGGV